MTKRDLLALEDWSLEEVDALLELARRVKRGEVTGGLEKRVLGMVFLNPDPHTRLDFETAMFLHGGKAVVLERGLEAEDLIDTASVLGRVTDALTVRALHDVEARPARLARLFRMPQDEQPIEPEPRGNPREIVPLPQADEP